MFSTSSISPIYSNNNLYLFLWNNPTSWFPVSANPLVLSGLLNENHVVMCVLVFFLVVFFLIVSPPPFSSLAPSLYVCVCVCVCVCVYWLLLQQKVRFMQGGMQARTKSWKIKRRGSCTIVQVLEVTYMIQQVTVTDDSTSMEVTRLISCCLSSYS